MKNLTVFLGGTCGKSMWREKLIPMLNKNITAFNPVVSNWTSECQRIEDFHKEHDDIVLFVITSESDSTYSFYEIGCESVKNPNRLIVCFLNNQNNTHFDEHQEKENIKITKVLQEKNIKVCNSLEEVAQVLNEQK